MSAVRYKEPELCRLLCERGDVDADKGNQSGGYTPLHDAAYDGCVEYMMILLDVGKANVNTRIDYSYTPLHLAACEGHIEAATLLIERGAEINSINIHNQTPLGSANMLNNTAMIAFLKTKGAT